MSHPHKHILVHGSQVSFIDFERARKSDRVSNVTQFLSFLGRGEVVKVLAEKEVMLSRERLVALARNYTRAPNTSAFAEILDYINKAK